MLASFPVSELVDRDGTDHHEADDDLLRRNSWLPSWSGRRVKTPMMKEPITVPPTVPMPPMRLVPPMTDAAIALSS